MDSSKQVIHDLIHTPGNPRNSEGAFLPCADGSIRFLYTRYSGKDWHDHAEADIAQIVSRDKGISWSEPEVVISAGSHIPSFSA